MTVGFCSPISSAIAMYSKESSQVLLCNNVEKNIFFQLRRWWMILPTLLNTSTTSNTCRCSAREGCSPSVIGDIREVDKFILAYSSWSEKTLKSCILKTCILQNKHFPLPGEHACGLCHRSIGSRCYQQQCLPGLFHSLAASASGVPVRLVSSHHGLLVCML